MIADDVLLNRALLGQIFQEEYEIIEAENGQEAIEQIELYCEEIALLLLDIKMPVLDGFAVMEYMKQKDYLSRIPVVLITGDEDGDAMEK